MTTVLEWPGRRAGRYAIAIHGGAGAPPHDPEIGASPQGTVGAVAFGYPGNLAAAAREMLHAIVRGLGGNGGIIAVGVGDAPEINSMQLVQTPGAQ